MESISQMQEPEAEIHQEKETKMAESSSSELPTPTEADVAEPKKASDAPGTFLVPALPLAPPAPKTSPVKVASPSAPAPKPPSGQQQPPPPLKYEAPAWSSAPPKPSAAPGDVLDESKLDFFYLEVLKQGKIIDKIVLDKPYMVFGRLEACDVLCEHPTLSRYHAVLQYSDGRADASFPKGYYIFDLNSTHGTYLNKSRVDAYKYNRVQPDSLIKFGQSTRLYIMHGPLELEENMSRMSEDLTINMTHEQMKKFKEKQSQVAFKLRVRKEIEEEEQLRREREERGEKGGEFDWGMKSDPFFGKDAGEDEDGEGEQAAVIEAEDESYYSSDPRKALKNFFDREGDELEYEVEELGTGKFKCSVRLPILNDAGEYMVAEVTQDGKKKECMAMCALEACRILHAEGVLKTGTGGAGKRGKSAKDWESADYYDSDEDTYLDRTGDIEKKRQSRMAKAAASGQTDPKNKTHTFESLKQDIRAVLVEQNEIERKLEQCKHVLKAVEEDDIDQYINSIKANSQFNIDAVTRAKMKRRKLEIVNELKRFDKLMGVAKPADFDYAKWKEQIVAGFESAAAQMTEASAAKLEIAARTSKMDHSNLPPKEPSKSVEESPRKETPAAVAAEAVVVESAVKEPQSVPNVVKKKPAEQQQQPLQPSPQSKRPKMSLAPEENEDSDKYYSKFTANSDYATWVPPTNQSGDGKTKLNEKYGY